MRWLFALLLVANAALFMWGRWYREPLVDPGPAAAPREVAPEKIKLLSEPGVRLLLRSRAGASAPAPGAAAAAAAPAASGRCYRVGPFDQPSMAEVAGEALKAAGFDYRRLADVEDRDVTYHVYLPPLSSRQAAERRRRELTALGFRDHALIQDEGLENAISLGVFALESNARARVAQLARRGVIAQVRTLPAARTSYWLALAPPTEGVERLERMARRDWGAPGVGLQPAPCVPAPATASRPAG